MMKELLKKLQKKSNKKGFTLVEIIVVLVILAILAAIAVPSVIGYVDEAKESRYIQEARSIYTVIQTEDAKCQALNNGYLFDGQAKNVTVSDSIYKVSEDKLVASDTLKDQITSITTLENPEVTVVKSNVKYDDSTKKSSTSEWEVKWKSDDKKYIKATIKKNKDIKIDKKASTLDELN